MCTLIALHRCFPGVPLVVAANRDEFLARPSEGPALRWMGSHQIVAPRDARAGGTWLGVNASGVFAAVTNRPCPQPDPTRRSRGLLVVDVLEAGSADEAAEKLESVTAASYNPFNLFVADRSRAFALTCDATVGRVELQAGAHVIGNADPAVPTPKVARLKEKAAGVARGPEAGALSALAEICAGHDGSGDALRDTCVHAGDYGTKSSTLLRLTEGSDGSELRYADGPPCVTAYGDFSPLLRDLRLGSGYADGETITRKVS